MPKQKISKSRVSDTLKIANESTANLKFVHTQ